jgi:hypothetical protein
VTEKSALEAVFFAVKEAVENLLPVPHFLSLNKFRMQKNVWPENVLSTNTLLISKHTQTLMALWNSFVKFSQKR